MESFAADKTVRLKKFRAVMYFMFESDLVVVAGVFMGGRSETNLKDRLR